MIAAMSAEELVDKGSWGCVDAALPDFLIRHEMSCFIINGKFPNRVIDVIEGKETQGTKLA